MHRENFYLYGKKNNYSQSFLGFNFAALLPMKTYRPDY
jgi:hypothetical protein